MNMQEFKKSDMPVAEMVSSEEAAYTFLQKFPAEEVELLGPDTHTQTQVLTAQLESAASKTFGFIGIYKASQLLKIPYYTLQQAVTTRRERYFPRALAAVEGNDGKKISLLLCIFHRDFVDWMGEGLERTWNGKTRIITYRPKHRLADKFNPKPVCKLNEVFFTPKWDEETNSWVLGEPLKNPPNYRKQISQTEDGTPVYEIYEVHRCDQTPAPNRKFCNKVENGLSHKTIYELAWKHPDTGQHILELKGAISVAKRTYYRRKYAELGLPTPKKPRTVEDTEKRRQAAIKGHSRRGRKPKNRVLIVPENFNLGDM